SKITPYTRCSNRLTIKSGSSSHKSRSACLPAIFGCLPLILACRLPICREEIGDPPQVGSWFSHVRQSERPSEHQESFALSCIYTLLFFFQPGGNFRSKIRNNNFRSKGHQSACKATSAA